MTIRQSGDGAERPSGHDQGEKARLIGERLRAAMQERDWWNEKKNKPDVSRLVHEYERVSGQEIRWQTVQKWTRGETVPSTENATIVAEALGVTLEELLGVALGHEPVTVAWREFRATSLGQSMTDDEARALASMLWPNGPPNTLAYSMALSAMRATKRNA